jgi:hypothetical protein
VPLFHPFVPFDLLPTKFDPIGIQRILFLVGCSEDVRMASHELVRERANDVFDREGVLFRPNLRMKDDLQEHVAQLFTQPHDIRMVDRLQHFIGFLHQIGLQRLMSLLPIPGTPIRRPQPRHQLHQIVKRF